MRLERDGAGAEGHGVINGVTGRPGLVVRALFAAVCLLLLGCGTVAGTGAPPRSLTVFAASSLTEALDEIGAAFEAQHAGVDVEFNFAGSSTLATQLLNGAQADVFASADTAQAQRVVDGGLALGRQVDFATNRLVVVAPEQGARVKTPADMAGAGVRVVLALPEVPVGRYSLQALQGLESLPGYEAGFTERVLRNVISEEPNVRLVLSRVALGEADAGMVYATDVVGGIGNRVRAIPVPESANVVAHYPVMALRTTPRPDLARSFVEFLTSPEGQAVMRRHGFGPP